jgi:predicted lipid-binding transport protein (Tim44 family)
MPLVAARFGASMNRIVFRLFALLVVLVAGLSMVIPEADARRLGGGKSFGRQSTAPMQRDARPAQQAAPQQAPQRAGAAPGQSTGNRWLAPLAGIAAGLGLAALASHLGLGEAMGSFLLLLLLAAGAIFVLRAVMARRASSAPQPAYQGGYSASQLGREAAVRYSADEPVSRAGAAAGAARAVEPGVRTGADASVSRIPADFDVEGFERNAKVQFVRLQAVFDAGDTKDLREFTTPEMYAELALQIDERRGAENRTDVVTLDATLLDIDSTPEDHMASVRFSGMIREDAGGEAKPFDEVWNLVKPAHGSGGWVLAGIQQLD